MLIPSCRDEYGKSSRDETSQYIYSDNNQNFLLVERAHTLLSSDWILCLSVDQSEQKLWVAVVMSILSVSMVRSWNTPYSPLILQVGEMRDSETDSDVLDVNSETQSWDPLGREEKIRYDINLIHTHLHLHILVIIYDIERTNLLKSLFQIKIHIWTWEESKILCTYIISLIFDFPIKMSF